MRIGLIGAGAVAPLHARAAGLLPGLQLTAVCDIDAGAAREVAEPIGADVFTDYRALIASGTAEAVIVNTPHALHRDMAVAAARAGLHVLVEKPMAVTLEDCDAMVDAADDAGVVLRVGQIQHFLPEKSAAATAIAQGAIGRVQMVHDYRTTDYRPGSRSAWFLNPELAGGGAVMNIGGHCIDRVLWMAGAEALTVSATTLNRFGVAVETDATMRIQLANDVTAAVSVVSDSPRRRDELTVVGELGSLVVNPRTGTALRRDGETLVLHEPSANDIPEAFVRQLADFAAAVAGAPSAVSLAHSRHVVELVLAVYSSAANGGRPVHLDPSTPRPASVRTA
jgi:predicted dehydrogenase